MSLHNFKYHYTLAKYRKNKKGLCPIYLRIFINGEKTTISTNKAIKESQWLNTNKKLTSDKEINKFISSLERKLVTTYNRLVNEDREVSAQILKLEFLGTNKREEHTIIKALEFHNKEMERLIGVKYSKGTLKNYKVTLNYIRQFIPLYYSVKDLALNKLNYQFLKQYEQFLTTKKNCTNNGVMKQVQRLKKVVNLAIANEWLTKDPFIKFKINYVKKDRGYLTLTELEKIEKVLLNKKLAKVRDYFMFSCYTGLAYADIKGLTEQKIELDDQGNEWIVLNRQKTKIQALIPILPKAKLLLDKYRLIENPKEGIFPVMSNQKTNDYLKEIAVLSGVKKRLSYHLARHTFATTITLSNGVPIETVSKMLGHTKIATTQIYSRVLRTKILNDMENLK